MKTTIIVVLAVIALAIFFRWRLRSPLMPESLFVVEFDSTAITVTAPNAEKRSIPWSALTKVGLHGVSP